MKSYKSSAPFSVAMRILTPTDKMVKGTLKKTYSDPEDSPLFYGSFRTFGGTETNSNGIYTIADTAYIETWYRPDIKSDCRIYVEATQDIYDVIGNPENINMRNQYLKFKIEKTGGDA